MKKPKKIKIKDSIVIPENLSVFDLKGEKQRSVVARKTPLFFRGICPGGYCDNERHIRIYGFPVKHKPFYDSWGGIFVGENAMVEESEPASKNPKYLFKIAQKCEKTGEKLWDFSLKIKKTNFAFKNDQQLKDMAEEAIERLTEMSAYLLFPLSLQSYFEETIKNKIIQKVKDKKLALEYFDNLMSPAKQNFGYYEQVEILKLAKQYKSNKQKNLSQQIKNYLFKFDGLAVKYGIGNFWKDKDIMLRVNYLAKRNPEEKLKHLLSLPQENERRVKEILNKVDADKNLRELVQVARLYVYLRTYRTDIISGAMANFFPLFKEISRRNKLTVKEVMECLPNEILDFKFPSKKVIRERSKANVIRGIEGKAYCAFGKDAIKIRRELLKNIKKDLIEKKLNRKIQKIKGRPANKGTATGVVKVVLDNSHLTKVKAGDVLVTSMTTPDFIAAMEKAVAFITNEGGILCHAAIVSREMNKPCIIGTKIATQVLRDGDLVEVDANKGVVKILKF